MILIPLTISINTYINTYINTHVRKNEIIKDRGLEKAIKEMLQTNYSAFKEELTESNLQKINRLYIWENKNVYDLQGIEQLKNLEELYIDSGGVKNFEALGMLINLKELTISDDNLYRLERIMGLESLEKLRLSYVKINKGASIDNLCGLKELSIHKAKFKDLSFVKELKSLEELELCESEIGDIDKLQKETDFKIIIKEEDFLDKMLYK